MIPKIIHYCWFGGKEKPKLVKKCIESWSTFCPDYEIVEWNERNYDVRKNPYTSYCFENGKWAYLSDFVRLDVVFQQGGLYFDTDVELISSFDKLLDQSAFFAFENDAYIATGLGFGAEKGHAAVRAMLDEYPTKEGHSISLVSCPDLNTKALLPYGLKQDGSLQRICDSLILPVDYMNPYDDPTGRLKITHNTMSIHWYSKSALSKRAILRSKITRPFHRAFGVDCFKWLKR